MDNVRWILAKKYLGEYHLWITLPPIQWWMKWDRTKWSTELSIRLGDRVYCWAAVIFRGGLRYGNWTEVPRK